MTADDRRVKERLVGASILLMLLVLIVPELLSGPAPRRPASLRLPASAPEPIRNITVDLATSKASAADPAVDAAGASIAQTQETASAAVDAPVATSAEGATPQGAPPGGAAPGAPPGGPPAEAPRVPVRAAANAPRTALSAPRLETRAPSPTSPSPAPKPTTAGGAWAVQLGSFASRANADKLMRQLKNQGFQVYVVSGGSGRSVRYRVRVGPLADRGAATQAAAKLKMLGHASSFVPPAR
jgi:DedD protein